ncbi:MAG: hypothetical protein Q4A92_03770 [Corynebacterium sp.]|nr:hypothetical protein [Corynebacterium sp.]
MQIPKLTAQGSNTNPRPKVNPQCRTTAVLQRRAGQQAALTGRRYAQMLETPRPSRRAF